MQHGAVRAFNMTPGGADATPPQGVPFAQRLYIGQAGTLEVVTQGGDMVTYPNVAVGYVYVTAVKVIHSGTTAAGIIGEYIRAE
jgi:hypothetical protein